MDFIEKDIIDVLETFVTPAFNNLIVDYDVKIVEDSNGDIGVEVDVIMDHDTYYEIEYKNADSPHEFDLDYSIEQEVRKSVGLLSPSFIDVTFYVTRD